MKKLLSVVLLMGIASGAVLEAKGRFAARRSCQKASRGCRTGACRRTVVRVARPVVIRAAYSAPVTAAPSRPARTCVNGMCSR